MMEHVDLTGKRLLSVAEVGLLSAAEVRNGASKKSKMSSEKYFKVAVCLCLFLLVMPLAVMGQELCYPFTIEKDARKFGDDLEKDWGLSYTTNFVSDQWFQFHRVCFIAKQTVNGKSILRNDFSAKSEAESFGNRFKKQFNIDYEIIDLGNGRFGIAAGSKAPGKYLVIVISYSKRTDAETFSRELIANGYTSEIFEAIVKGVRYYRVTAFSCDDQEEAKRLAKQWEQRNQCTNCAWFFERE